MPDSVVLVAEDDVAVLDMMENALENRLDVRVAAARDGLQAIRQAKSMRPALVVLDRDIPGMDGLQVIRLLRSTPSLRDTRIIGLIGREQSEKEALAAGCDASIPKPVIPEILIQLVQRHLPSHAPVTSLR